MEIIITGKDFKLTPSIKVYIEEHSQKLLRFRSDIELVKFELDIERHHKKGENFRVEGWVHIPGRTFAAGAHATEMHAAIDILMDKLVRQVARDKEKMIDRKRKS